MLFTPVPWESIFPAEETPTATRTLTMIDGRQCLVRHEGDGQSYLERLLSTDPQDYLDPRFAPETPLNS